MTEVDVLVLSLRMTPKTERFKIVEYQGEKYIFSRDGEAWNVDSATPMELWQKLVSLGMVYIF